MNLCVWTMLVVAIPLVREGRLNGVYLAVLALAAVSSFEAALPLSAAAQGLQGSLVAARRLFSVIDAPPVIRDPVLPSPVPSSFDLEVCHLSFGQRVEIRRNFVQQENRRVFEQGTGDGKALTLSATQLQPLLSD